MRKVCAAIICLLISLSSTQVYSDTGSYSLKEKVELDLALLDEKPLDDEEYQKVIISSVFNGEGFCRDSFSRAFVRNFFSSSKKSILTITINKIPYVSYTYDQKNKACNKTYSIESELFGLELARKTNRKFIVTLLYNDEAEIGALQDLSDIGKSVSALGTAPVLSGATSALVDMLAKKFDKVVQASLSSKDLHQVEIRLPNEAGATRFQLSAKIASKHYDLLNMTVVKQPSRLYGKRPSSVMTTTYRTDGTSAQSVIENYRAGPGAAVGDVFDRLRIECNELRSNFSLALNEKDMRALLESHLLHNYSPKQTRLHLLSCFNDSDISKVVTFELKEYVVFNDAPRPDFRRDPSFLSNLNQSGYSKITTESTLYFDKGALLPVRSVGQLVALPNIVGPFCYQFLEKNKVNFIMFDRVSNKTLYFEAVIDKEYSAEEYEGGMLSIINSLSVDSAAPYEYNTASGIAACIDSRKSNIGMKVASASVY